MCVFVGSPLSLICVGLLTIFAGCAPLPRVVCVCLQNLELGLLTIFAGCAPLPRVVFVCRTLSLVCLLIFAGCAPLPRVWSKSLCAQGCLEDCPPEIPPVPRTKIRTAIHQPIKKLFPFPAGRPNDLRLCSRVCSNRSNFGLGGSPVLRSDGSASQQEVCQTRSGSIGFQQLGARDDADAHADAIPDANDGHDADGPADADDGAASTSGAEFL